MIAVILSTGHSMCVHGPVLLGQNILSLRVVTVRFAEPCLVSVWRIASDWLGGDTPIVSRVQGVSETVVTAYRAALGPPQTGLACSPLLSG